MWRCNDICKLFSTFSQRNMKWGGRHGGWQGVRPGGGHDWCDWRLVIKIYFWEKMCSGTVTLWLGAIWLPRVSFGWWQESKYFLQKKTFCKNRSRCFCHFYMDFFQKTSQENMLNLNVFFTDNHHTLVENIKSELGWKLTTTEWINKLMWLVVKILPQVNGALGGASERHYE